MIVKLKEEGFRKYCSHLPVLTKILMMTSGPVLELGGGLFSTPVLHWLCINQNRKLITYEDSKEYFDLLTSFNYENHEVIFVEDWDKIDIDKKWDVAFIDHRGFGNGLRRGKDAIRLAKLANYVILHDTCGRDEKKYGYREAYKHFKYKNQYNKYRPRTSVLSNFVDVTKLKL